MRETTFIPKGVYFFKTLDEADAHRDSCLAKGMARLARRRLENQQSAKSTWSSARFSDSRSKRRRNNGAMAILWDPEKARSNLAKHGVAFDEAETIFYDPLSKIFDDPDHSIGERRFVMAGYSSSGRLVVVSYAEHDGDIRIINARLATALERKRHEG